MMKISSNDDISVSVFAVSGAACVNKVGTMVTLGFQCVHLSGTNVKSQVTKSGPITGSCELQCKKS